MNKIMRVALSILAAILIWPIVLLIIVICIEFIMTLGLISIIAYSIYNASKQ